MATAISEFTGEPVDTASEEWRHECECRYMLDHFTTRDQRNLHIEGVPKPAPGQRFVKGLRTYRGDEAAQRLVDDTKRLFAIRKERSRAQPAAQPAQGDTT